MEILGQQAWHHTIVLFTHGDSLGGKNIEMLIENRWQNLKPLLQKCGNRYHIFNNNKKKQSVGQEDVHKTDSQVTELLEKIEEMVLDNDSTHYKLDRSTLEKTLEKRKQDEQRAKARVTKVEEQRKHLQSLMRKFIFC